MGGCKKFSKRMAMQSNCNGSSSKSESQKNNETSGGGKREFRILILVFSRQGVWLSQIRASKDRPGSYGPYYKEFLVAKIIVLYGHDLLTI